MERRGLTGDYGGDRFRSHLEARWAIFFDQLELKWEYEPQGFKMDGTTYLPDFAVWAAGGLLWVEIKPEWDYTDEGVARWRKFAIVRPQPSRAVLLTGKPAVEGKHVVIGGDEGDNPASGPWEDDCRQWRPCPAGYHFDLAYPGKNWTKFAEDECPDCFGGGGEERIEAAVQAALSHRFGRFQPPQGTAALCRGERIRVGELAGEPEGPRLKRHGRDARACATFTSRCCLYCKGTLGRVRARTSRSDCWSIRTRKPGA